MKIIVSEDLSSPNGSSYRFVATVEGDPDMKHVGFGITEEAALIELAYRLGVSAVDLLQDAVIERISVR